MTPEEASPTSHMLDDELDAEIKRLERQRKVEHLNQLQSEITSERPNHLILDRVEIPKFDGTDSNFHFWVQNAALYLYAKDLGDIIGMDQDGRPSEALPVVNTQTQFRQDLRALSLIRLNLISDNVARITNVTQCKSSAQAWRAIYNVYHRSTRSVMTQAIHNFISIKQEDDEPTRLFASRMSEAVSRVRSVVPDSLIHITAEFEALVMLLAIHGRFSTLVSIINAQDQDVPLTTQKLISMMLEEEKLEQSPPPRIPIGVSGRIKSGSIGLEGLYPEDEV